MQVWNVLRAARCKCRTQKIAKNPHLDTIAQLCRAIPTQLMHVSTIGKSLLNSNVSPTCPHGMVNFGLLAAEICWRVWGILQISTGFTSWQRYWTLVVGVSRTLRHWTERHLYSAGWPSHCVCVCHSAARIALWRDHSDAMCSRAWRVLCSAGLRFDSSHGLGKARPPT